jgi:hypothetical protein
VQTAGGVLALTHVAALLGEVNVVTLRAEDLHGPLPRNVGLPDRQAWLPLAVNPRAPAKVDVLELLQLSTRRHSGLE